MTRLLNGLEQMMSEFVMLVGLPASGKSTLANKLSNDYNTTVLSSDQLRIQLYNNINDQEHNEEVFKELHKQLISNLKDNHSVIYDATNISYKRRKALLEEINKFGCKKICYLLATPYDDCLVRNDKRERKVPKYAIKRMYMNFYIPEYYEGWDEIHIDWNYDCNRFNVHELFQGKNGLDYISQDNPHHTLTIGEHCKMCSGICKVFQANQYVIDAGLYHDIGKKFTKQFKNAKGEATDIAHYYNHMNVSAYDALFYLKAQTYYDEVILKICNYIQWHMQLFFTETDKAKNKFIRLVGQTFYDDLMLLHQADMDAK